MNNIVLAYEAWKSCAGLVKELTLAVKSPDYDHSPPTVAPLYDGPPGARPDWATIEAAQKRAAFRLEVAMRLEAEAKEYLLRCLDEGL